MIKDIRSLFPEKGVFFGLDISHSSTGFALVKDREITTGNITLNERSGLLGPALDKQELKEDLVSLLDGLTVDVAVVESIFFGGFVESFSRLASLTYAVEELIIEERIDVRKLVRAQSTTWKSWLRPLVKDNRMLRGNQGKEMVKESLRVLNWTDSGKGYEDRLDALGMVAGYFLRGPEEEITVKEKDLALAYMVRGRKVPLPEDRPIVELEDKKVTVPRMIAYLKSDPGKVYCSKNVFLGFERERLKIINNSVAIGSEPLYFWFKGELESKTNEWIA